MSRPSVVGATAMSGADVAVRYGVQLGIQVVLARLLAPADFGVVALLALILGVAAAFVDGGFSTALVQRRVIDPVDESTAFWFSLAAGVVLTAVVAALGVPLAGLYGLPVLAPLTAMLSLTVLAAAVAAVPLALLTRDLNFRAILAVTAASTLISGAVAIWLAVSGAGVWALAWQAVSASIVTAVGAWIVRPRWPGMRFSTRAARALWGYGGFVFAATLLDLSFQRLQSVVVGTVFGMTRLGYYNRAETTQQVPSALSSAILGRVSLPVFATMQDDVGRVRGAVSQSVRVLMVVNVPVMTGLAVVAGPAVRVLFGPGWEPAVPLLSILCLAAVVWPVHVMAINVLLALGRSRLVWRIDVVKKVAGVSLLAVGTLIGLHAVAWSQVAFSIVGLLINGRCLYREIGYTPAAQLRDCLPALGAGAVMAAVVVLADLGWNPTRPLVELGGLTVLGAGVYVGAVSIGRVAGWRDLLALLGELRREAFGR